MEFPQGGLGKLVTSGDLLYPNGTAPKWCRIYK